MTRDRIKITIVGEPTTVVTHGHPAFPEEIRTVREGTQIRTTNDADDMAKTLEGEGFRKDFWSGEYVHPTKAVLRIEEDKGSEGRGGLW